MFPPGTRDHYPDSRNRGRPGVQGHPSRVLPFLLGPQEESRAPPGPPSKRGWEAGQNHLPLLRLLNQAGSGDVASVSQAGVCCVRLSSPRRHMLHAQCGLRAHSWRKQMTNRPGADLRLPGRLVLRVSGIFCASGSGQGGLTVWHRNAPKWPLFLNPLLQTLFGIYLQLWEVCWRKFLEAVVRLRDNM